MRDPERIPEAAAGGSTAGCLRAAFAAPALLVLAPVSALVRRVSRWRRGRETRAEWSWVGHRGEDDRPLAYLGIDADLPLDVDGARALTEAAVRLAERLADGDSVYHMVHRETGGDEVAVPLGPSIQALAERFSLTARRVALEGIPVVWIALPRKLALGEVLETAAQSSAAEQLLGIPARWGMVVTRHRGLASVHWHLDVVVPDGNRRDVESAFGFLMRRG
jgi:hypothetical protein